MFFTLNGELLSPQLDLEDDVPLYPCAGIDTFSTIDFNFGEKPFSFDIISSLPDADRLSRMLPEALELTTPLAGMCTPPQGCPSPPDHQVPSGQFEQHIFEFLEQFVDQQLQQQLPLAGCPPLLHEVDLLLQEPVSTWSSSLSSSEEEDELAELVTGNEISTSAASSDDEIDTCSGFETASEDDQC